jgi:hypothetical protein
LCYKNDRSIIITPKKKAVVQNETTVAVEKEKKLPLFSEPKIKARKFDLF